MSAFLFYSLFYCLISGCLVYPPTEFVSAGLTVKDIFAAFLGRENDYFVQYHIRRSTLTLLVHSALPLGYILGLIFFGHDNAMGQRDIQILGYNLWPFFVCCTLLPLYVFYKIFYWLSNDWSTHPIAENLSVYCNNNTNWILVASDINREYQSVDKIVIHTNSVTRIIATDNWIIKVTPYRIHVAHQSDTALIVNKSDTHVMSPITRREVQFINIEVKPTRLGAKSFDIRLNAFDFKDLQDRVSRPITILQNITFHKTLIDRFIDTFKEQVDLNPRYQTSEELDHCIGCMENYSNIKLYKLCDNSREVTGNENCTTCYCRPMWCIECMAKWFASRQNETAPETWMSSKCTCPLCRARFCLLDVCFIQSTES